MGLFDRFKKPPPPNPPSDPPPPSGGEGPQLPADATIATFNEMDSVGTLTLGDGASMRFGASTCRGFSPVVGLKVRVTQTKPHPLGGVAAAAVELATAAAGYDAAIAKRDQAAGVKSVDDPVTAAATSEQLGWIIVLLDEPVPTSPAAFLEWAKKLALPEAGVRVEGPPMCRLTLGSTAPLAYPGSGPFRPKLLEAMELPPPLAAARGFIGLSLGLPGTGPVVRMITKDARDPWGPDGRMRDLSRLAALLAKHGPGVVLPQGQFALPTELFLRRLGDLADPLNRPLMAWVALSYSPEHRRYRSLGMTALELLNVSSTAAAPGAWAEQRARDAALFACHRMVRESVALEPGATIHVPVGIPLSSAGPLDLEGLDTEPFTVGDDEGFLSLTPVDPPGKLAAQWEHPQTIKPTTYHALLRCAAQDFHHGTFVGDTGLEGQDGAPDVTVEVYRVDGGTVMHTVGAGLPTQPGGTAEEGTAHVELVAVMGPDHPFIARVVAVISQAMHQHPPESPYRFGDTITLPVEELGAAGFLLRDAGNLGLGAGEPVSLMEVVPLTQAEIERCRGEGSSNLSAALGKPTPASRAPRWQVRMG